MQKQFDIIGVGVGPANLALLAALQDNAPVVPSLQACFFDAKETFSWHEGMMIPYMELQVPFFRDLATLRNPTSKFTFLNYLKQKGKLDDFINLRTFYPTRIEFADYLGWAAKELDNPIKWGYYVTNIEPVWNNSRGFIEALKVLYTDLSKSRTGQCIASNIVIATGQSPYIPAAINPHKNVIHTSDLLKKLPTQFTDTAKKYEFIVIGGGQSAGEAVLYLLNTYPNAKVEWCFRDFALHSADSNPFMNKTYHQASIDDFYNMSQAVRNSTNLAIKHSNYSVVDLALLNEIYKLQYTEKLVHKNRLHMHPGFELTAVDTHGSYLEGRFQDKITQAIKNIKCDGLILATGYIKNTHPPLLNDLKQYLTISESGEYEVQKDYSLCSKPMMRPKIFLHGLCERSHGPSDQTLSVLSTRAGVILDAILQNFKDR